MAGEGGQGPASAGEPAGGAPEEAGGAAAEDRETPSSAGGETETETREEQGDKRRSGEPRLTQDAVARNHSDCYH